MAEMSELDAEKSFKRFDGMPNRGLLTLISDNEAVQVSFKFEVSDLAKSNDVLAEMFAKPAIFTALNELRQRLSKKALELRMKDATIKT